MLKREYAEWVNFWWENAPDTDSVRVMLIGDSITNSYRGIVQELLKDKRILVDMTVGSRGVEDPALFSELEYALGVANGYKYKLIHFNNGIHADYIPDMDYEAGMKRCIEKIKVLQPDAKLVLVTSTPYAPADTSGRNKIIFERNAIVKKLADEYNLELDDLFAEMYGKTEYAQPDNVHFGDAGKNHLGKVVTEKIISMLL